MIGISGMASWCGDRGRKEFRCDQTSRCILQERGGNAGDGMNSQNAGNGCSDRPVLQLDIQRTAILDTFKRPGQQLRPGREDQRETGVVSRAVERNSGWLVAADCGSGDFSGRFFTGSVCYAVQ